MKTNNFTKKVFEVKNLVTGEVKAKVRCYTLAAAQEYFNIVLPGMTSNDMIFEIKGE